MAAHGVKHLKEFDPSDHNACAPEWEMYKRDFLVHLDAIGLDEKPGKRKVGEQSDGTDVHRAYVNNAPRHKSRGGNRRPRGNFWRGHTDQKKNPGYANQQYCEWCCKHHSYKNCPAYNQLCNSCGEKGHFRMSKRCRQNQPVRPFAPRGHSSYRGRSRGRARGNNTYHRDVHYASGSYEDENYAGDGMNEMFDQCHVQDVFTLKTNSGNSDSDWIAELNVAGKSLSFEIDSGARYNILSKQTADMFRPLSKVEPSDIINNGVSDVPIKSYGKMTLPCVYKDTQKNIEFQVIERNLNILGRDDSTALGLIVRVNSVQSTVGTLTDSYADVVGDEIGCLPGEYEIKIDETVTPVIHPPRPVPTSSSHQGTSESRTGPLRKMWYNHTGNRAYSLGEQHGVCEKKEWQSENLHRPVRFKQSDFERAVPDEQY